MALKEIKTTIEVVGRGAHEWENIKAINENFAALEGGSVEPGDGGIKTVNGKTADGDGDVTLTASDVGAKPDSYAPAWGDVTGKPATFAPVIGSTATTAMAGNTVIPPAATVDNLDGTTTVGKSIMKATDAAAARTAIGAGTSNLAIGTTASTAKAGDYVPAWADVTGKPTTFAPIIGTTATTAKAGNAVQTATQTPATVVGGGTATDVQGILAELEARIAALEAAAT